MDGQRANDVVNCFKLSLHFFVKFVRGKVFGDRVKTFALATPLEFGKIIV